ncbi:unnamed protein product [Moneuplotes crassus]|uniref:Uncharacterized protein n=1 Tax=Euplotes crassus TaxID=5936 RepID=A0AAD1UC91_EUPCR|nr:unnamed protein product [Moneuplotes crassus]
MNRKKKIAKRNFINMFKIKNEPNQKCMLTPKIACAEVKNSAKKYKKPKTNSELNNYLKEFFPKAKTGLNKEHQKRVLIHSETRGPLDFKETMTTNHPRPIETPNLPRVVYPTSTASNSERFDTKRFMKFREIFNKEKKVGNFVKTFNMPVKLNNNKTLKRGGSDLKIKTFAEDEEIQNLTQMTTHFSGPNGVHISKTLKATPFSGNRQKLKPTNMQKFKKVMSFTLTNKLDHMMDKVTRLRRTWNRHSRGRNRSTNIKERNTGILIKDNFPKNFRSPNMRVTFNLPDED